MTLRSIQLFCCLSLGATSIPAQLRVACIGDSITYGSLVAAREHNHYPAQLAWRLGDGYDVRNFGQGGCTLLGQADSPYTQSQQWPHVLEWAPDVALIILGTNDTCQDENRHNWEHQADLEEDARAMIAELRSANTSVRVLLSSPPKIFPDAEGLTEARRRDLATRASRLPRIAEALRRVADELDGVEFLDLSRTLEAHQVVDGVHPTPFGAEAIANRTASAILMPGAPPIDLEALLKQRSLQAELGEYHGFRRYDFRLTPAGPACILVAPHVVARDRPWLWRMRFFGHEPDLELDLLERGFHLAYVDVSNLFGAPPALARLEPFYELMCSLGLAPRPVLLGMSRGGLPLLAWAGAHPDKSAALVGDNLVCDLRTWPGGQGGKRSDADWEGALEVFGWSESEAQEKGDLLLRNLEKCVGAGVPLFLVQGLSDTVVPAASNGLLLAERWRKQGGRVEIWPKPNQDHHPHGLHPPAPLVRAILHACDLGQNPATRSIPAAEYRGHPAGWGGGTWWDQLTALRSLGRDHPNARLVFLGDSITQGLTGSIERVAQPAGKRPIDAAFGVHGALDLGLSGDRTEHLLYRIEHGALGLMDPDVIVLQIGVNNLNAAAHTARETAAGIHAVVTKLQELEPQAHLIVCGPFPAGVTPSDPRRATVNEIHASIAGLDGLDRVRYLDLRALFLSEDGRANALMSTDGIHITTRGQVAWMEAISPIVRRALDD